MNKTLEAYGRSLNIKPACDDGSVECRWEYPPPCERSQNLRVCFFYGCNRSGGQYDGPEVTYKQLVAEARVADAIKAAALNRT